MKPARLADVTIQQLVDRFAAITLQQDRAIRDDDNSTYNRLIDRMLEIDAELKGRAGDQRRALLALLDHPGAQVRLMASIAVLKLAPDDARQALQTIVDHNEYPQAADARGMLMSLDAGRYIPT